MLAITNYYVLEQTTERTVAICGNAEDAEWIAINYKIPCLVRVIVLQKQ